MIAGERRWRAAERLGWARIPAIVKEVDDRTLLTLALIENLQRDDLSPIDEAAGYRRLGEEFQLGHAEIGRAVGRERSTVANLLRLLQLPAEVQAMVHEKRLSAGHARALLGLSDAARQSRAGRRGDGPGVVGSRDGGRGRGQANHAATDQTRQRPGGDAPLSADVKRVEDALRKRLGTDVRVTARRRGRGLVTISYYSNDDLSRVLELILGGPFEG